jgi:hypothetical protein
MHRVRAKVNAAGPFHASEIRIDGDRVENARIQQFQKHAAAPFGLNGKNAAYSVVESDFQPGLRQWFSGNDPNHGLILLQRRDFGRLLILAGQFPSVAQFRPMQRGPFENERLGATAHAPLDHFQRVHIHLDFFALINRMKMRRRMIAIKHADDNPVKPAQFRHGDRLAVFHPAGNSGATNWFPPISHPSSSRRRRLVP